MARLLGRRRPGVEHESLWWCADVAVSQFLTAPGGPDSAEFAGRQAGARPGEMTLAGAALGATRCGDVGAVEVGADITERERRRAFVLMGRDRTITRARTARLLVPPAAERQGGQ